MIIKLYYRVAGLAFAVELYEGIELETRLSAYKPFVCNKTDDLLFRMPVIVDDSGSPSKDECKWRLLVNDSFKDVISEIYVDTHGDYHYVSKLENKAGMWSSIDYNREFSDMKCRVHGDAGFQLFALNNALMLMFALCSSTKETLLFHASVVKYEGKGYLFLGKSGTGKSTHSQLWLNHIKGCELLNDDYPAIRLINGKPCVFGTPWSGKTPCYKNEQVLVGGFIRLWQAPVNEIKRLSLFEAYGALLPTVTNMRWEKKCADAVSVSIQKLIEDTPVFSLKNRPEKEAAVMSFHALTTGK